MNRRRLLQSAAAALAGVSSLLAWIPAPRGAQATGRSYSRVRPDDPEWPSEASWDQLNRAVGGQLVKVRSPFDACTEAPLSARCAQLFKELKNPYYLGDEVGLTQSLGWVEAWTSRPSAYAVAVRTTEDAVAAVNFAREN